MLPKSIVLFLLIVAVKSATLQGKNIPVEIRYERLDHNVNSNFAEKVQLSEEELKENQLKFQRLSIAEEDITPKSEHQNFVKNFDEKVQLSPEELLQSAKYIPIQDDVETLDELLEEPISEHKSDAPSRATLIEQAQQIIESGLNNLRENFKPNGNEVGPSKELWEKLERDVQEFFSKEKNNLGSLRQQGGANPTNIFQNIANGIQQVTNNFIQQFQGQNTGNSPNGTTGDEGQKPPQQQGPFQGFVGYFTGGVQNMVSSIQNIAQGGQQNSNSTVLGDTGTGGQQQQPGNFIGNFISGVQQIFQVGNPINALSPNGTQGDTGSGTGSNGGQQQGFFGTAVNQISQVVSNFIPTPAPQKPSGSADEASSQPANQPSSGGFIQQIGSNINQAFQNIQNQFRPPSATNQKPDNPPQQADQPQGSKKPVKEKPTEEKPVEEKPVEEKPAAASASVNEPSAEDKPEKKEVEDIIENLEPPAAAPTPINKAVPGETAAKQETGNVLVESKQVEKQEEVMTAIE